MWRRGQRLSHPGRPNSESVPVNGSSRRPLSLSLDWPAEPFRGFGLSEGNGRTDTSGPITAPGSSRQLKLAKESGLTVEVGSAAPLRETPPLQHRRNHLRRTGSPSPSSKALRDSYLLLCLLLLTRWCALVCALCLNFKTLAPNFHMEWCGH